MDPGSKLQLAIAVIIAALYLAAYIQFRPFVIPEDDIVAEVAAWSIFLTLFVCFMIRTETSFHRSSLQPLVAAILFTSACLPLIGMGIIFYPYLFEQIGDGETPAEQHVEQQEHDGKNTERGEANESNSNSDKTQTSNAGGLDAPATLDRYATEEDSSALDVDTMSEVLIETPTVSENSTQLNACTGCFAGV